MVNVSEKINGTLHNLRLRRKYSAVILDQTPDNYKLLNSLRDYIAFGVITEETLSKLIDMRGQLVDKSGKIDSKKIVSELGKKSLQDLGLKPFFRLHPPRKGIESKKHFGVGKGVLGDNKDKINELLERML